MALSKPACSEQLCEVQPWQASQWGWMQGWSFQAVCGWGEQLQNGCRQLQEMPLRKAADIDVVAPLAELSEDLIDFSLALGRRMALPLVELGEDLGLELHLCASRRPSKHSVWALVDKPSAAICKELARLAEDRSVLPFLIAGLLSPTPSGMLVLAASTAPAFPLKVACLVVGTSMLWKCWVIQERWDAVSTEDVKTRKLALAITGISGAVNLGLAFGGLPALMEMVGYSSTALYNFSGVVAHPTLFVHYAADLVLNPMLLLNLGYTSKMTEDQLMPAMVVSVAGAGLMIGSSLAMSPLFSSVCAGANVCCILMQNFALQTAFSRKARARRTVDAYVFAQALYVVPTVLVVTMSTTSAVALVPLIDLLGKMGVVQLTGKRED